ncbi:Fur family transcriptional regulator [Amnibacterium kyonggiense]
MKRNTWQRAAVRGALAQRDDFVSAQELHAELKRSGSPIGLATVYRALADLSVEGEADSLRDTDGESRYRACATSAHHHHLICRSCGRAVEIEADAIEEWAAAVAAAHGFVQPQHVVDVFGTCAECTARGADPSRDELLSGHH